MPIYRFAVRIWRFGDLKLLSEARARNWRVRKVERGREIVKPRAPKQKRRRRGRPLMSCVAWLWSSFVEKPQLEGFLLLELSKSFWRGFLLLMTRMLTGVIASLMLMKLFKWWRYFYRCLWSWSGYVVESECMCLCSKFHSAIFES